MPTPSTVIGGARRRAPTTPPPAPAPGPTPPPAPDPLDYFNSLITNLPPSSASLISIEERLREQGITVLRNARGIAGKIKLASGEIVDVGQNFGSPRPETMRWQTLRSDKRYKDGVLIGAPPATPPGTPPSTGDRPLRRGDAPGGEQAVPRGSSDLYQRYASAYDAQRRQRRQAGVGGRAGTILGGFGGGTPRTRPTILGRAG